jgi:thiol-disulfide isomerase/thioredoxin
MKKFLTILFLISSHIAFSQAGKIYLKNSEIKPGVENVYVYEPPKGLLIPDDAVVRVVYDFVNPKPIPLIKTADKYEFYLKLPDSSNFVMLAISDIKKNIIDNNLDKGFVIYLKNKNKGQLEISQLNKLRLSNYANYALGLKITPEEIISEIEKLYKQNPTLKKDQDSYTNYLQLKYSKEGVAVKPEIIKYANILEKKADEKSLSTAIGLYEMLRINDKSEQIKTMVLKKYPHGEVAKNDFFNAVYSNKNTDEKYILDRLAAYEKKFNDSSAQTKNRFYTVLIQYFLYKKDLPSINKYEALITDKINAAGMYNNTAWGLSGENLTSPGTALEFAEQISKKSVDLVRDRMHNPVDGENSADFQLSYIYYADTYALIMYKQKKYDEAYKIQNEIYLLDTVGMGADGRERYAAYMEKVMGLEYTKGFIERQSMEGKNSALMITQLQEIYKKLNLPESEFEKIKQASLLLAAQKLKKEVIAKYGDIKAVDFTLTNLEGKKIKLSDYKGKVVVLDFWATWCGPCRASFPNMQQLVNEYKNKDVEFFFIDVWQDGTVNEINKEVSKFIADTKYTFNVLYDYKSSIATKYKIEAIPAKIVIDKNGDLLSIGSSEDNLRALIDENIK